MTLTLKNRTETVREIVASVAVAGGPEDGPDGGVLGSGERVHVVERVVTVAKGGAALVRRGTVLRDFCVPYRDTFLSFKVGTPMTGDADFRKFAEHNDLPIEWRRE